MPKRVIPFVFGRVREPEELLDRLDELATVKRNLPRDGRLSLIGPRRFGKADLLHERFDGDRVEREYAFVDPFLRH